MTTPQEYYNAKEYHEATSTTSSDLYTEEEVSNLLQTQRENCYVAVLNATLNNQLASNCINAPEPMGGDWRKK